MKCFENFLKKNDNFGIKFGFRINNRDYYGSVLGGCCYFAFLCIAVLFVVVSFRSYLKGTTFTIVNMEKSFNPAKKLNVTEHHFTFAVRLTFDNGTSVTETSLKDVFMLKTNYVTKSANSKNKETVGISTCSPSDFFSLKDDPVFNFIPMNTFLCFKGTQNLVLQGTYTEPVMKYLDFSVSLNPSYIKDYTKLENIFASNQFKLTLYYTNPLYDVSNRDKPVFFELSSFYTYLDLPLFKRNNIDFQEFVFADDQNIIIEDYKPTTYMKMKQANEIPVTIGDRSKSTLSDRIYLAKYFLRAYNMQSKIKRQYMKVPEFLASAMALLFNLLVIMGIVVYSLNTMLAKQSIMKRVIKYKDDLAENPEIRHRLEEISENFPEGKPAKKEIEDREDKGLLGTDGKPQKPRNNYLIRCCDITKNIFCCGCRRELRAIYDKAEKRINYLFDIVTYMKKIHEVEMLKHVLLDEHSVKLMNFISRPGVSSLSVEEARDGVFKEDIENKFPEPNYLVELDDLKKSYDELNKIEKGKRTHQQQRVIEIFEKQISELVNLPEEKKKIEVA